MKKPALIFLLSICIAHTLQGQNIGIGTVSPGSKLDINGDMALRSAAINIASTYTYALDVNTAKQVNYKLTDNNAVGNFIIAGITAGADGRQITLFNRTGSSMQLFDEDATALPADRVHTGIAATLAVYTGGSVTLRYDAGISRWEVVTSHYNSLDYFGGGSGGNWDISGTDIFNNNTGNVGVGTSTPSSKLTVSGNFALSSDTVMVSCAFFPPPGKMIIDNAAKNRSVYHIISGGCGTYTPPLLAGLTGGTDGKIVTIISHVNNLQVQHLQGNVPVPVAADSLNMIELYEPNGNGTVNQPSGITLNNGGSITLMYDKVQSRWKLVGYSGDIKSETYGWLRGVNPADIYNPNGGKVGIGTGTPTEKFDVNGNARVRNDFYAEGNAGIGTFSPAEKLDVNGNVKVRSNLYIDGNTGIGTATPTNRLQVVDANGLSGTIRIGASVANSGYPKLVLFGDNNYVSVGEGITDDKMELTAGQFYFKNITGNGNVGIGISSANASLAVARGTGTDGTAAFFGTTNTSHFNYSTAEDTYLRGGKITSKLILNDYGGQVTIGTSNPGNAQLNIQSSRTGANANGLSISQSTSNPGSDSYGLYTYVSGSNQSNIGFKSEVNNTGLTLNAAGFFQSDAGGSTGNNTGIVAKAGNSLTRNTGGQFEVYGGSNVSQNFGLYSTATGIGVNYGVYCAAAGAFGQQAGIPNYGIYAIGPSSIINGYAGFFDGNVFVTGLVMKSGGTFSIDHPLDPANKYLNHSFVESPDMMNIYNGNVITGPDFEVTVELPAYFTALNKDYRYQLTTIGQPAQVWIEKEISDNKFVIRSDKQGVKISWQVTGIRQDAWANAHRIIPEVEKQGKDKGKYLTPEVFGHSKEEGIHFAKSPEQQKEK